MKLSHCVALVLTFCSVLLLAQGCGSSNSGGGGSGGSTMDEEGYRMCCELGAVCHEPGLQAADVKECHDIGHLNDPEACRESYERCLNVCRPRGEGGAGGEAGEHLCVE
jgi:hypothetical protein